MQTDPVRLVGVRRTSRRVAVCRALLLCLPLAYLEGPGSEAAPTPKPAPKREQAARSVAIPAYFYPAGGNLAYWEQLRRGHPAVSVAIATGLGLDGSRPDANYQEQIRKTRAAGIRVLGYVTTSGGSRSLQALEKEMDNAYAWYEVDGIFFDECVAYPVTTDQVPYYAALNRYAKAKKPAALTVINHGQILPEEYAGVADIMMNAEMTYDSYTKGEWRPWGWESRYPSKKFWHLVHAVDTVEKMREVVALSRARNAGHLFVTTGKMSDPGGPWGSLPPETYWKALLEAVTGPTKR